MGHTIYKGNIALDRLVHVRAKKKNKDGKMIDVLIIPVEANKLEENSYETRTGEKVTEINIPVNVVVKSETDSRNQDGFIAKNIGPKTYKAASGEQKEAYRDNDNEETKRLTPILGNIKDWNKNASAPSNMSQAVNDKPIDADDDDLPF